ncbi:MAG: hypothetical protein ABSG38_11020 [Spirochaetia bacterium]|jgi:hypothetical protein
MPLFAKTMLLLGTENAFKIGPKILAIEGQGKKVIKCNLGEPDFPEIRPNYPQVIAAHD